MSRPLDHRSAFSLMELLLVVVIIGIIAAIVVPRVASSTDNAKLKVRESHVTQMNAALEQYSITYDGYPTNLSDLAPEYLPDGVPTPPDGGTYSLNSTTNRAEHTP